MERETTDYEANARRIAESLGLTVTAAFKGDRCPPWAEAPSSGSVRNACPRCGSVHGDRYRVTLRMVRAGRTLVTKVGTQYFEARQISNTLSFDFWASYQDQQDGKRPSYYDILSSVASDASMPTDPDEVVAELGEMKPSQAIAAAKHAARLQAFFTAAELVRLSEIQ